MPYERRYPIAAHLREHWTPLDRTVEVEVPLGEGPRRLIVLARQYAPPAYFLGQHYLGVVTLDGEPLRVTERYRYHSITNSGVTKWSGGGRSDAGECACSEIVMASDAGARLSLSESAPGVWEADVAHSVDQSFHEVESDDYWCRIRLDEIERRVRLDRNYFRDAST